MHVLIVCSGNSNDGTDFDVQRHQAFIYEQVNSLGNNEIDNGGCYVTDFSTAEIY